MAAAQGEPGSVWGLRAALPARLPPGSMIASPETVARKIAAKVAGATPEAPAPDITRVDAGDQITYTLKATLVPDEDLMEYICAENEKDVQHFQ